MYLPVALAAVTTLTYAFALIDRAFHSRGLLKPYYGVHVIHNAGIVILTAYDVWLSMTQFHRVATLPINWAAICLCYALHLYHTILYWRSFHADDWIHHISMIAVALPLGCTVPAGPLMGFSLFFTTGLPGGVVYGLMFAERNGWITKAASRPWCAAMNLWLRAPGCCAHAALTWASVLSAPAGSVTSWQFAVAAIAGGLNLWNGQYFLDEVIRAANRIAGETAAAHNTVRLQETEAPTTDYIHNQAPQPRDE
jgi:hypothetical protein